jgi:signal transduction histidine kinase/ActR/RegA family two-component response regulator
MPSENKPEMDDKKLIKLLRQKELALRMTLSTLRTGVVMIHRNTHAIVGANPMAQLFTGIPEPDIFGRCCRGLLCKQPEGQCFVTDLDEEVSDMEAELVSVDGTRRIVRKTELPVEWAGETYIVASFLDVTAEKEAEQREAELQKRLMRAERLETLGVLAGGVAHDLNNILGPLVALPDTLELTVDQLAAGEPEALEAAKEQLRWMRESSQRAANVVNDLVTMGRCSNLDRKHIDLRDLVRDFVASRNCADLQATFPEVKLETNIRDEAPFVQGSADHLLRALGNLVTNAFQSIQGSGTVTINVLHTHLDHPRVGYEVIDPGDYVLIQVRDTGCGLTPNALNNMFEPFFTTKPPDRRSGSGLGLSVTRGIVKDHDGFIHVSTTSSVGTGINIYLPSISDAGDTEPDGNKSESPAGGAERLLTVDDNPEVLRLIQMGLGRMGYSITKASCGRDAVALFAEAHHEGLPSPFDIVLLDMIMEPDFDGLATLEAILSMYPEQKVIMVSGHSPERRGEAAMALGANWITKPFTFARLHAAIRERMDGKGTHAA